MEGKGGGFQGLQGSVGESQDFERVSGKEGGISEKATGVGQAEESRVREGSKRKMNGKGRTTIATHKSHTPLSNTEPSLVCTCLIALETLVSMNTMQLRML